MSCLSSSGAPQAGVRRIRLLIDVKRPWTVPQEAGIDLGDLERQFDGNQGLARLTHD